ncbi:MAG: tRNA (adenosine(37)-N6)-threonylcarbamoyltransferase complex dimerization subunit type 1 TsaB [Clostridia bacterium]|nr:tRNA (adenosine(37)-N6)-threonylcarbamoyltransferase complex dimerization subunit type 1 TsaB [Clostridia bacterium]
MLAINTAFMTANLVLKTEDRKVVMKTLDAKSKHSENVLNTIDLMCEEAQVDIMDVDKVAVVTGPGSFTGLRIGVAIAKALGCANEKLKFISLSSLELMAYIIAKSGKREQNFVCAINALSNLFFVATFDKNGIKLDEERIIDKQQFEAIDLPRFAFAGDFQNCQMDEVDVSSADLLQFAELKAEAGEFVNLEELLPKYLRLSQAEDSLLKKVKKDV